MPVGLLGSYLYQFRFFINTFLGKYTDKAVDVLHLPMQGKRKPNGYKEKRGKQAFKRNISELYLDYVLIAEVIKALEGTVVIHILEVVGGGLAAIGIATTETLLI
ncbi:hypothetical protein EfmAA290_14920 [Enterococcus faecium]|nr:hypothetical protein EfmAA290_14920 [Enterococcus faecium]